MLYSYLQKCPLLDFGGDKMIFALTEPLALSDGNHYYVVFFNILLFPPPFSSSKYSDFGLFEIQTALNRDTYFGITWYTTVD